MLHRPASIRFRPKRPLKIAKLARFPVAAVRSDGTRLGPLDEAAETPGNVNNQI
jgi:hypothetical protein